MGKYFMQDKRLSAVERAMTQIPRASPDNGGSIGLCRLRYSAKDPYCQDCQDRRGENGEYGLCPYARDRLSTETLSYRELVERCFRRVTHSHFRNRLRHVSRRFPAFSYADSGHARRLAAYLKRVGHPVGMGLNPWDLAALYLITARETLWRQAEPMLRGKSVCVKGLDVQDYALYQMAKALRRREILVSPGELADKKLTCDETLRLIINAVLVAMCGQTVINHMFRR